MDAAAKAGVGLTRLDSRHVEKHGLQDGEALQRNHLDYANHKVQTTLHYKYNYQPWCICRRRCAGCNDILCGG